MLSEMAVPLQRVPLIVMCLQLVIALGTLAK